ncbi:50S ribosomal protein L6 [Pyrobaculum aerophilum]|uniref:Large ribosomal subunit protein uL6 n=2 Tax=Pyrobaculum aerophilum TaxID=13773 RepID=RL6_PYRAE|nr:MULTISPECIES: 50S ribosomal protein L6 [Pyrobaculum]Q8ZVA7.1 RecName: Full=Large ribosomal subunit protein uL6; AltName: Full=50S ribosomal protein L6 [Pyrobaculum aerophilum str. IM2]AAL64149.1 ribosomal protein L6 [Pyrobaculum aerophilum str. IM2]MCX8137051.1 50S ribosomal protein L6 [Pyrobaculum aerophilum]HII47088.1 50S ribosomal protein L6 [Pyrobaculum aerophilum]
MRVVYSVEEVEIPKGVSVSIERTGPFDYIVKVKGPLGEVTKEFKNTPVVMSLQDGKIVMEVFKARKREYAILGTYKGILKNMFLGVTRGWRYKLKVIYTHFPMLVKVQGNQLVIENFLGRKSKITLNIPKGVKVEVKGKEDIVIEGIDRELVSTFAAAVQAATELHGDERPSPHGREGGLGVVDGIYVVGYEHIKS